MRPSRFQAVSPWRTTYRSTWLTAGVIARARAAPPSQRRLEGDDRGGRLDDLAAPDRLLQRCDDARAGRERQDDARRRGEHLRAGADVRLPPQLDLRLEPARDLPARAGAELRDPH